MVQSDRIYSFIDFFCCTNMVGKLSPSPYNDENTTDFIYIALSFINI